MAGGRLVTGMELIHLTRNTPRRWQEVLDGGSIFWVIKGVMCARQPIIELRAMQRADGRPACGIVLAPNLIAVEPLRVRIFQGWRYLGQRTRQPTALLAQMPAKQCRPRWPRSCASLACSRCI